MRDTGDVGLRVCEPGDTGFAWGACGPAGCTGYQGACTTTSGQAGVAECSSFMLHGACGVVGDCSPDDPYDWANGCESYCVLKEGQWNREPCTPASSNGSSSGTPLVLSFHGEHVSFTRAAGAFDVFGREATIPTDWVSAVTPWLAVDLDGNGRIDDGRELFGSMTVLPDGARAFNGFVALAALDEDGDGEITARDPGFDRLLVWSDANQDRQSSPDEISSARGAGLVAIALGYRAVPRCEAGNCEIERASFVYQDADGARRTGEVVDVHLAGR